MVSFVWSQGVGGIITPCPDVLTVQFMLRYSLGFMGSALDAVWKHHEWHRQSSALRCPPEEKVLPGTFSSVLLLADPGFLLLPSLVCAGSQGSSLCGIFMQWSHCWWEASGNSPCLLQAAFSHIKLSQGTICRHISGVCCNSCSSSLPRESQQHLDNPSLCLSDCSTCSLLYVVAPVFPSSLLPHPKPHIALLFPAKHLSSCQKHPFISGAVHPPHFPAPCSSLWSLGVWMCSPHVHSSSHIPVHPSVQVPACCWPHLLSAASLCSPECSHDHESLAIYLLPDSWDCTACSMLQFFYLLGSFKAKNNVDVFKRSDPEINKTWHGHCKFPF